eukprot:scaffold134979_cov18-Tisochrysis_lutea.AAC.2
MQRWCGTSAKDPADNGCCWFPRKVGPQIEARLPLIPARAAPSAALHGGMQMMAQPRWESVSKMEPACVPPYIAA